jgi:hypothetical protein
MGGTIPTTLFGCDLALLGSFRKLAAPRLASATETSRETLAPMVDMVTTRGDWHEPHLVSHSNAVLTLTSVQLCSEAFRFR